jgi:hypothetical protein
LAQTTESIDDELARRHRMAAMTVVSMLGLTLLLVALAFAGVLDFPARPADPFLKGALSIGIVLFGFGAVTLRRTRFASARLQDIAALRGASGLLATLQNTTMLVALAGGAIALMGFVITMNSGDEFDMVRLGLIAVAVLLYAYPRRSAWQRVVDSTRTMNSELQQPPAKGTVA